MSPKQDQERINSTPPGVVPGILRRGYLCVFLVFVALLFAPLAKAATDLNLTATPGGIAITPSGVNYQSSFGTVNALGIGPASQTGVSIIPLTNGALYYSTYNIDITGGISGNQTVNVKAFVSLNFSHPAAVIVESCPSTSSCNSATNFSAMSTSVLAQTTVIPSMRKGTPTTAGLAIFVPDNDGASAYTGNDSATITLNAYLNGLGTFVDTVSLSLSLPQETVQTAVQLQLATVTPGLNVALGSDYSMAFGTVNALGIGPSPGLTTNAQAGGMVYSTPYNLLPAFTDFSSTSSSIKVCVSTPFIHSAILVLNDSSTGSAGSFSNISTSCSSGTSLTTSAADRSKIKRYLGLFVSSINGAAAYTGTDSATLTYTLTVP